jgi:hypothetical protein
MRKQRIVSIVTLLLLLAAFAAGCGSGEDSTDGITYFHHSLAEQRETEAEATEVEEEETYLVTVVDQVGESLQIYSYANGMEYRYYYGTGTLFYDKYGERTTISSFEPGTLVTIGMVNSEGILCKAQISDKAWVYDNITRYSVDDESGVLKIADTKYRYDETTRVFSGADSLAMTDIGEEDTLSVTGVGRDILAVRITTSQGTLALKNTSLFEGSFVQVGTKIFAEITEDMELSVPEGTYDLIVANNGWGGSESVTIVRGTTTVVDLDEIKGKGPANGEIQFVVDVEDAMLLIDGVETDYEDPVTLTYGSHTLTVYASGYDVWKRNLYVNSESSTVVISLTDEEESDSESTTATTTVTESSETENSQESSESDSESESEKREEELETIKDLITSLTSASSILSD